MPLKISIVYVIYKVHFSSIHPYVRLRSNCDAVAPQLRSHCDPQLRKTATQLRVTAIKKSQLCVTALKKLQLRTTVIKNVAIGRNSVTVSILSITIDDRLQDQNS